MTDCDIKDENSKQLLSAVCINLIWISAATCVLASLWESTVVSEKVVADLNEQQKGAL